MSEIKFNSSFLNKPLFKINENDTVDLDKKQLEHYFDAINIAREKTLSYHNTLIDNQYKIDKDIKSIKINLNIIKEEYNKLNFFKKLSKEGRDWKELLNNEENILKKTTDNLNKINNELKTETQDYHKENKTINKLEKFFKSIPESLISYNNQVQEKINKQSELNEYEEIIEIIQNEIKTTDNIEEKKNHLNDFIALKKDHKTIKNEIDSINLNLKNLRQDAQKNLNEAKFSLKQVDKELYRKIKQENYIKSTITRINEDIVDKTINLFNNSIYLASQATKLSVNLLTKGTEKLKNLFTKSKEQPNKTSKKINKDDLVR